VYYFKHKFTKDQRLKEILNYLQKAQHLITKAKNEDRVRNCFKGEIALGNVSNALNEAVEVFEMFDK